MYDLDRKIIFTHPPKCAGTTIEDIFGWRPGQGDEENKIKEYIEIKHWSLQDHVVFIQNLGLDPSGFFKFSCVRNPWDRAVSFFFHHKYSEIARFKMLFPNKEMPRLLQIAESGTFENYLDYRHLEYCNNGFNFLQIDEFINFNGENYMDYIVKYENLNECIDYLKSKYSIDADTPFHRQRSQRPLDKGYKEYYTKRKMITKVMDLAVDSIKLFGYTF